MRGKILNWESPDILIRLDRGGRLVIAYRDVYKHCLGISLRLFPLTLLFLASFRITFSHFSENKADSLLPYSAQASASALADRWFAINMIYTNLELSKPQRLSCFIS